jgi:hypothetical protein
MRIAFSFVTMVLTATALGAACSGLETQESLCNPGENTFCRCRGGTAGTKQCLDDGNSFGSCETMWGDCAEVVDPPDGGHTSTSNGGSGGGEAPPPGELLGVCGTQEDCGGGEMTCPMGYCTKVCSSYEDCQPAGDCVLWEGSPICMPYCITQDYCAGYGASSACSYTPDAVPAYEVLVCANWPDVTLPPDGWPSDQACESDEWCNLGIPGRERVCDAEHCTSGCHQTSDCADAECSSSSVDVLGTCGAVSTDPDLCPGEPVTVSTAAPVDLEGDTSQLADPSEYTGTGGCLGANPTEEWVYAVTPQQSGTLEVYVVPDANLDAILYARQAPCTTGTQIGCVDDGQTEGAAEDMFVPVTAGQTVYVFIDGWDTTEGTFLVEFSLAP